MKHANKVNRTFVYTRSEATDISKRIARERRRLEAEKAKQPVPEPIVRQIGGRR